MVKGRKPIPSLGPAIATDGREERPTPNRVRELREERKWTQWQLARISRLSERTIQRIERGGRLGPTAEMALAGALGVPASDLYGAPQNDDVIDFVFLKRIVSGAALLDLGQEGANVGLEIDQLSETELALVGDFFESFFFLGAFWKDIDGGDQAKVREMFNSKIDDLDARGLWLFGRRSQERFLSSDTKQQVVRLAIARADDTRIVQPKWLTQIGKQMCGVFVVARRLQPVGRLQILSPVHHGLMRELGLLSA